MAPGKSTVPRGKIGTVSRLRPAPKRLNSTVSSRVSHLASRVSRLFQVAMAHHHLVLGGEALAELLGDVDRAVAPAGAADRDGERSPLVEHEARQPALEEALDVFDQESRLPLALEECH